MQPTSLTLGPYTSQSFYTPNKAKNVSFLQTNPSSTLTNNITSNEYTSVELSESLRTSPSFYSPNKQLSSFLNTPNQNKSQYSPSNRKNKNVQVIKIHDISPHKQQEDDGLSDYKTCQNLEILTKRDINSFLQLKQMLHFQVIQYSINSQNLKEIKHKNEQLESYYINKQEDILYHKKEVQKQIKKRNVLRRKLANKKQKRKQKQQMLIAQFEMKIKRMQEEIKLRETQLMKEHVKFKSYANSLQKNIQSHKKKKQQRKNIIYIPIQPPPQNYRLSSTFQRPSGHQQQQFSQYFRTIDQMDSGRQYSQTSPLQIQKTTTKKQKLRKHVQQKNIRLNDIEDQGKNAINSPINFFSKPDQLVSPIGAKTRYQQSKKFYQQDQDEGEILLKTISVKEQRITKKTLKSQTISDQQYQSQVNINLESIYKAEDSRKSSSPQSPKKTNNEFQFSPRVNNKRFSLNDQNNQNNVNKHSRFPSNLSLQAAAGKRQAIKQSIVNIEYSSQKSSNMFQNDFLMRSPEKLTEQKQLQEEQKDYVNDNFLKIKNVEDPHNSSSRSIQSDLRQSGQETPGFRSQETFQVRFSKPFLNGSYKNSQAYYVSPQKKLTRDEIDEKIKIQTSQNNGKRKRTKEDDIMKTSTKLYQTTDNNQLEQPKKTNQDDDFWSCTLAADSKIISKQKSSGFDFINEEQSQKLRNSQRDQNFDDLNDIDEMIRGSAPSQIYKLGEIPKEKQSNTHMTLSGMAGGKLKQAKIQTVVEEQSQQSQQARNYTERKSYPPDLSKSTL